MGANALLCMHGSTPFTYLGLRVGGNMNYATNWLPVIETFQRRLTIWKASKLSFGGRITLIKSVLDSLPCYYLSIFRAPSSVLDKLELIRRRFFWGGTEDKNKIPWVSWDRVTDPLESGGLGIGKLKTTNLALLAKWWWRFRTENNMLWKQVVVAIRASNRSCAPLPLKRGLSSTWPGITKIEKDFLQQNFSLHNSIAGSLGNGNTIRFWIDNWLHDSPLKDAFPNLYNLEARKDCLVRDRLRLSDTTTFISWEWSTSTLNGPQSSELSSLSTLLTRVHLSDSADSWTWSLGGPFTVRTVKKRLAASTFGLHPWIFSWNKIAPLKVNIHCWRAELGRLPSKLELVKRNILTGPATCPLCQSAEESVEHLLTGCYFAAQAWNFISNWCRIPAIFAFSVRDLFEIYNPKRSSSLSKEKTKLVNFVIICSCWLIWKIRNNAVFSTTKPSPQRFMEEIKLITFTWITARSKFYNVSWDKWSTFNFA